MNKSKLNRLAAALLALIVGIASVMILPVTEAQAVSASKEKSIKRTASVRLITKKGKLFDFRKAAKQKLYGYDTLQGACANDGYAYLTLYDRTVEKCKIVKVDLNTLKVVKVSAPLPIYHGNNLTFNTKKNLIVATCCRVKDKRAVFIDPDKLKVKRYKDISLSGSVKNLPQYERRNYEGFTAIAYNSKKNCYVGRLRGSGNVIVFDGNLVPKKYVRLEGNRNDMLNQGMDSVGNYIYDVRSFVPGSWYSIVTVHTMSGKFVGQVKFPYGTAPGNELQCIFHDGKQFYAGTYYSTSQYHDTKKNHVKRVNRLYRLNNMI